MKIKRKQLYKLKEILENDRNERVDDFLALLKKDIGKVLGEYFEYKNGFTCDIKNEDGGLKVNISLTAERIKDFNSLP